VAKTSRCVLSEKSSPRPHVAIERDRQEKLSCCAKSAVWAASAPLSAAAEGTSNAIVARNNSTAWSRVLARLNSCTWCSSPPSRNDAPRFSTSASVIGAVARERLPPSHAWARSKSGQVVTSIIVAQANASRNGRTIQKLGDQNAEG